MTDVSISLPAKRKRGRPRKDGNLYREGSLNSPKNPNQCAELIYPPPGHINKTQEADKNPKDATVDGLVGSMVYGVIEGSFDAGYLISARIGSNETAFRGVVFQPRKFVPVTAANDIAPQAKMYHRREIPVPVYGDQNQISGFSPRPESVNLHPLQASKEAVFRPISPSMPLSVTPFSFGNHSTFTAPETMMFRNSSSSNVGTPKPGVDKQSPFIPYSTGSLRMVEEDEVMQAFEVSKSSKGSLDMISDSLFKATASGLPVQESINQNSHQFSGKAVESGLAPSMLSHDRMKGSNAELHHNYMEDMPRCAFEIQRDEMSCPEMQQPREFAQQPQAMMKTELQPTDLYYSELGRSSSDVNFHQNLLANHPRSDSQFHLGDYATSTSNCPNLKLDISSTVHENRQVPPEPTQASESCLETNYMVLNELKNPNIGYQQALVAGNPLLLPPGLTGEPLEFMLRKPESSPNKNEEDSMRKAEAALGSPSAPYKLELATPQSAVNTRPGKQADSSAGCIAADMEFDLSEVVQPAESLGRQS